MNDAHPRELDTLLPKIRFIFERGGELVADLSPKAAPQTTKRVLEILPYESTAYHTRWCGREVYSPIKSQRLFPKENQTATANIGDVTYWREWETAEDPPEAISIYYGAEVIRDHRGFLLVNVFAHVSQDQWPLLEEIGIRVWQRGIEKIRIQAIGD